MCLAALLLAHPRMTERLGIAALAAASAEVGLGRGQGNWTASHLPAMLLALALMALCAVVKRSGRLVLRTSRAMRRARRSSPGRRCWWISGSEAAARPLAQRASGTVGHPRLVQRGGAVLRGAVSRDASAPQAGLINTTLCRASRGPRHPGSPARCHSWAHSV